MEKLNGNILSSILLLLTGISVNSSPLNCIKSHNRNISTFGVLPGFGWDNLRNVEVSRVVEFNYSQCLTTSDGLYLLPDGVDVFPLKQTKLDQYSEMFDTFTDYTSVTAESINSDPGLRYPESRISGSYSESYIASKITQIREKSKVVRSQLRFVSYRAKLQPDATLSSAFKIALLSIARHVLFNRTEMARYESEALVRDFGTHVVTGIDVGAAVVVEDHLDPTFAGNETFKTDVMVGASLSLAELTGVNIESNPDAYMLMRYKENRIHSYVKSYGGSVFVPNRYNNSWTSDINDNSVAVDREGEPIYNFVNLQTLPIVPSTILYDVTEYIADAVRNYYSFNTYRGCTDVNQTDVKAQTNLDDGSCGVSDPTGSYLGAIFQQCEVVSDDAGDICSNLGQASKRTKAFACPTNFRQKLIHSAHYSKTTSKRECKTCYALFTCCDDVLLYSEANLKSFWCLSDTTQANSYLFSGMYSSAVNNIFTRAKTCPGDSFPRAIGDDINICITGTPSDTAVAFGGFYSCDSGNPLAERTNNNPDPKACPVGFSAQFAGTLQNNCELYYCVQADQLPSMSSLTAHRPPFSPKMKEYPKDGAGGDVVYDTESQEWLSELDSRELKESNAFVSLTSAEAAVIAIFITLLFVLLLALAVYFYRRSQKSYATDRNKRRGNSNAGHEDAV